MSIRIDQPGSAEHRDAVAEAHGELPDWEALYDSLGERVFRFLYRMTRSAELAEDLTHDTFVRVQQRRAQYRGRGAVRSWVFQIAANLVRDHMRRSKLRLVHDAASDPVMRRREEPARSALRRVQLQRALDILPDTHRVVVLLHDVDGFNHREIAEMLEIAEGTSKARLSRARSQLRDALGTKHLEA